MNAFRFRLEKVLEWRGKQLELEENKFRREIAALAALDRVRAELEAAGVKAEVQVRQSRTILGRELAALGEFCGCWSGRGKPASPASAPSG